LITDIILKIPPHVNDISELILQGNFAMQYYIVDVNYSMKHNVFYIMDKIFNTNALMSDCVLCPRECGINRFVETGVCGCQPEPPPLMGGTCYQRLQGKRDHLFFGVRAEVRLLPEPPDKP
jgi:hypothetical protein